MARKQELAFTTLSLEVRYNPRKTDPESLASAFDTLLETAMSTPDILDDYGPIELAEEGFLPPPTLSETKSCCQDCGAVWDNDDLEEIKHLEMRVDAGEPMPSGECPSCGALCQPLEE
jgi:hypothetical protein